MPTKRNENSYTKRLTGRTRPLKVISPVIAVSDRVHRPLERKYKILIKAGKSNHKQGTEIWQYLGTMSQLEQQEKLSQNFVFRENLHPKPSLFLDGLLSLWCFSISVNYYFQVALNLKVSLYVGQCKVTVNELP